MLLKDQTGKMKAKMMAMKRIARLVDQDIIQDSMGRIFKKVENLIYPSLTNASMIRLTNLLIRVAGQENQEHITPTTIHLLALVVSTTLSLKLRTMKDLIINTVSRKIN